MSMGATLALSPVPLLIFSVLSSGAAGQKGQLPQYMGGYPERKPPLSSE